MVVGGSYYAEKTDQDGEQRLTMPTIHDDDDDKDYNEDEKEEGKGDDYDSDDFEGFPDELSFAGSSNKVRPHSSPVADKEHSTSHLPWKQEGSETETETKMPMILGMGVENN